MRIIGEILIITSILSILINIRKNILILISLELLFIGISLLFISTSLLLDDFNGITSAIIIISISAIESAIGLILLISKNS